MNISDMFPFFWNVETYGVDKFKPPGPVPDDRRRCPVSQERVGYKKAQIVFHLEGRTAYLDRDAEHCAVSANLRSSHLEVRYGAAAAASDEVEGLHVSRQSQFFNDVSRDARTNISRAGIDYKGRNVSDVQVRIAKRPGDS